MFLDENGSKHLFGIIGRACIYTQIGAPAGVILARIDLKYETAATRIVCCLQFYLGCSPHFRTYLYCTVLHPCDCTACTAQHVTILSVGHARMQ